MAEPLPARTCDTALVTSARARRAAAMRRCTRLAQVPAGGHVVAIGMFDGLHLGHCQVLEHLHALGRQHGLPTLLLTFDPHPRSVVGRQPPPRLLCTVEERLELLAATGLVDTALVLPFDVARSQEPVEQFVACTLAGALGARALVVGANFACGHQRRGTVDRLQALGADHGFSVHALPLRATQAADGAPVCSSTVIRGLIQAGDVAGAAAVLGRPHGLTAQAVLPSGAAETMQLPLALCRPAAGRYRGAVGRPGAHPGWRPAVLEVIADALGEPVHARVRCAEGGPSLSAGPWRLRFDDWLPT